MTVEEDYQKCKTYNKQLSDMINDLTLVMGLWLDGYHFDDDDIVKYRALLSRACALIGKPQTMVELVQMLDLGDECLERARQCDAGCL